MKTRILIAGMLACMAPAVSAEVTLPHILGDNMLLQQQSQAKLWGKAKPGSKVTVTPSWNGKKHSVKAENDGSWSVTVATPEASFTNYTITIGDGDGPAKVLRDVLVGDVWICSGQSNMEMPLKGFGCQGVEGSLDEIMTAGRLKDRIRMFKVGWERSFDKDLDDCQGEWLKASSSTVGDLSAIAYFYGKYLTDILDIPVGVITPYWGGTRIEAWMPLETLRGCVTPERYEAKLQDTFMRPSELYCAMIAPLRDYAAKGFIWYQGEANLDNPDHYDIMMAAMVDRWRKDWGDNNASMPFYYAQIAPFSYWWMKEGDYPSFVEAQVRAQALIPNCAMAATTDVGDKMLIHPPRKREVGQRMASLALSGTYGIEMEETRVPVLEKWEVTDGKINITLSNAPIGLCPLISEPVAGFEIAGEDHIFHPAKASVYNNPNGVVTVWNDSVPAPVAVRYAWRNFPDCNLTTPLGIPVAPFRTDSW
ncbi:MAG: sialate O-acetylesterase [Bacteroidales bacterium]|nr:sialate O-acetylesterase [Bacteroidales bacterium]